jgi:hypothetical protein
MTTKKSGPKGNKKKAAPRSAMGSAPKASGYGRALFFIIEKRLKSSSKRRAYIPPEQIAQALRLNPGIPLPPDIHDYLCDYLDGKIRKPSGRKPDSEKALSHIKKTLIPVVYDRYLKGLRRQKRERKRKGLDPIKTDGWWDGPSSERAAVMTARRLGLNMNHHTIHNIVSKSKK